MNDVMRGKLCDFSLPYAYHIISYHIISYHIISYHIISYYTMSTLGIS